MTKEEEDTVDTISWHKLDPSYAVFGDKDITEAQFAAKVVAHSNDASQEADFGEALLSAVREKMTSFPQNGSELSKLRIVQDLGTGASARAFLACTVDATAFCVAKCARTDSSDWKIEDASEAMTAEAKL
jgi:hypothetical protein